MPMCAHRAQKESKFAAAYDVGIHKSKYWEPTFEDCMDCIAKVSARVRATVLLFRTAFSLGCRRAAAAAHRVADLPQHLQGR